MSTIAVSYRPVSDADELSLEAMGSLSAKVESRESPASPTPDSHTENHTEFMTLKMQHPKLFTRWKLDLSPGSFCSPNCNFRIPKKGLSNLIKPPPPH